MVSRIIGSRTFSTHAKYVALAMMLLMLVGSLLSEGQAAAQERITSTPLRIDVPTSLPVLGDPLVSATPTRTPTVPGPAMLEAKADAGDVNVRAEADPESERLGSIRAGEQYPVLGKYFRWYQIQFDLSPSGRAFVFEELVDIIGDPSAILDLSAQALPTTDPVIAAATETQEAITQTPGGMLTATAGVREILLPDGSSALPNVAGQVAGAPTILPTFTYPPDVVAIAPTEGVPVTPTASPDLVLPEIPDTVPPIVPIVILGGLGLLGLAVSSITRR